MTTAEENETIHLTPPDIPGGAWLVRKCVGGVSRDEVLTTIADIDLFAEILQENLNALTTYRKVLLGRAISEDIREDYGAILIQVPGKRMRNPIGNIDEFKATFREGYAMIRDQQKRDIEEAYQKDIRDLDVSPIPVTLADKKIGKEQVTKYVGYQPQVVQLVVQRKRRMSPGLLG